jgi:hypothetical protein
MAMGGVDVDVADGFSVAAVTRCSISLVLVFVVLAMLCCRAGFMPAIGADRSKTELQRHAQQNENR